MSDAAPSAARLAIVVPVHGHPGLVTEALESALAQEAPFGIHIVVVNDGCPQPETHEVLQAYALAHPDRLSYLRRPNGGLSAARNTGIAHVLAHLPQVEALFMLDADNRLRPRAMAQAMAALDAHPQAGWVYPSIDMFGIMARCDYGGPYSRLIHSQMNICEAGSLIRRAVFAAGVMFDESFKLGFEDWHFFLSAGDAGFRGVNLEHFGFFYRKRPESMLANADRNRELLLGQIRQAHPTLYHPAHQLQLEHDEAPRYALWLSDSAEMRLFTDPDLPGETLSQTEYIRRVWASQTAPMQASIPPYLLVTSQAVFDALAEQGLLHGVLWQLECAAPAPDSAAFATLAPPARPGHVQITPLPESMVKPQSGKAALWLIGAAALLQHLAPAEGTEPPKPAGLWLRLPAPPDAPPVTPEPALEALRAAPWRAAARERWRWRQGSIGWRGRAHQIARATVNAAPHDLPVLPRCPRPQTREIGILLPGTAPLPETCAPLIAALQPARADGARLHLMVLADTADLAGLGQGFDTLVLLGADGFHGQSPGKLHFDALPLPGAPQALDSRALAALCALTELHVLAEPQRPPSAARLAGTLRRWGIRTTLHLPDAPQEAPGIALTLAYEHAFDRIKAPTPALRTALRAQGLARRKLNQPSP